MKIESSGKPKLLSKGFVFAHGLMTLLPALSIIFSPLLLYFPYNYDNFPQYLTILIIVTVIFCFSISIYSILFGMATIPDFFLKRRLMKIIINRPDSIVDPVNCETSFIEIIDLDKKSFCFTYIQDIGLLYVDSVKNKILIECDQSRLILKPGDISDCDINRIDKDDYDALFKSGEKNDDMAGDYTFYMIKIVFKNQDSQLQELHIANIREFGVLSRKRNLKKTQVLRDKILKFCSLHENFLIGIPGTKQSF